MTVIEAIGATAARVGIQKLVDKVISVGRDKKEGAQIAARLERFVEAKTLVRTVFSPSSDVSLPDLWTSVSVRRIVGQDLASSKQKQKKGHQKINSVDELNGQIVVVQAPAGYGKSFLSRHTVITMLNESRGLPLLVEARAIGKNTLRDELLRTLSDLGVRVDAKALPQVLEELGAVCIIDGLDEVSNEQRKELIDEVLKLTAVSTTLRMVLTTRPDSDLLTVERSQAYELMPLRGDEWREVAKACARVTARTADVATFERDASIHGSLLVSPLLVSLLFALFQQGRGVPATLPEVYQSVLEGILEKHDGLKIGYKRTFKCTMSPTEFKQQLRSLAYRCCLAELWLGSVPDFVAQAARQTTDFPPVATPDAFVEDVLGCGLLQKQGERRTWIHRSFCEYFGAEGVQAFSPSTKRLFFRKLIEYPRAHLSGLVAFLCVIDTTSFLEEYRLPVLAIAVSTLVNVRGLLAKLEDGRVWVEEELPGIGLVAAHLPAAADQADRQIVIVARSSVSDPTPRAHYRQLTRVPVQDPTSGRDGAVPFFIFMFAGSRITTTGVLPGCMYSPGVEEIHLSPEIEECFRETNSTVSLQFAAKHDTIMDPLFSPCRLLLEQSVAKSPPVQASSILGMLRSQLELATHSFNMWEDAIQDAISIRRPHIVEDDWP